jgi:hypothetical protein
MTDKEKSLVENARDICLRTLLNGYEDAGIQGLCDEGRFEYAVGLLRGLRPEDLIADVSTASDLHPSRQA